jgi:hypothetical protein
MESCRTVRRSADVGEAEALPTPTPGAGGISAAVLSCDVEWSRVGRK